MLDHNYIGTEHILLGLVHEGEGVAAEALTKLSVTLKSVRQQVEEIIGQGQGAPTGYVPFTPRAKKVLELSLREALQLNHNYIGTEHMLLGLVAEGEGVGAQVLHKLGADEGRVRQAVTEILARRGGVTESVSGEGEEEREWPGPKCPGCAAEISVYAVYRLITIPDEAQSATRRVVLVFCRACSNLLGLLPE